MSNTSAALERELSHREVVSVGLGDLSASPRGGMAFGSAGIALPLPVGDCDPIVCVRYYVVRDIRVDLEAEIDSGQGVK